MKDVRRKDLIAVGTTAIVVVSLATYLAAPLVAQSGGDIARAYRWPGYGL